MKKMLLAPPEQPLVKTSVDESSHQSLAVEVCWRSVRGHIFAEYLLGSMVFQIGWNGPSPPQKSTLGVAQGVERLASPGTIWSTHGL